MARDVEGRRVPEHLEGALTVECERRVGRGQRGGLHRQCRHEQQLVLVERLVVRVTELAVQVLRLGVVVAAVVLEEVLADEHGDLERVRELVGPAAPAGVVVEQAGDV